MAELTDYTSLITSEHDDQPKFMAAVAAVAQAFVDGINVALSIPAKFDLDVAVGDQLDKTGQWVGLPRTLRVPIAGVYFSFDTSGVGFDQGVWWNPSLPVEGAITLDDGTYRQMLRAKIASNVWDGSLGAANQALLDLFGRALKVALPGVASNRMSTPHIAPTAKVDVRFRVAPGDWTPGAIIWLGGEWVTSGNQRAWRVGILTNGRIRWEYSTDGANNFTRDSTTNPPTVDGQPRWIKVEFVGNDGGGNHTLKFWQSFDYEPVTRDGTWTQIGTTVTTAGTVTLFNSTAALEVGATNAGADGVWAGDLLYAELLDDIDGTTIATMDPNDASVGATSWVGSQTGETWTVNQSGGTPAAVVEGPPKICLVDNFNMSETFLITAGAAGTNARLFATLALQGYILFKPGAVNIT